MTRSNLAGLSLRDLEYAAAVAEHRHFGRAAEQCGVSQPALSEQLRKLEATLGTSLFERAARRVEPTAPGEILLRQIRVVLREALSLVEIARTQASPLEGPLRLGVIPTLGPYYLPLVLRPLRAEFPRLELRLQEARTHELAEALHRGQLDAVLAALPLSGDAFEAAALFFEPFELLLPATHDLLQGSPPQPEALPGADLLLLEEGHCLRDQAISLCRLPGTRDARQASSLEMLRHMVAAGEGYTLIPRLASGSTSAAASLGGLLETAPLAPDAAGRQAGRTIGLVWRATDPRSEDFSRLAEFLRGTRPEGTQGVEKARGSAP